MKKTPLLASLILPTLYSQTFGINCGSNVAQGFYAADNSYSGGFINTDTHLGTKEWSTQRYGTLFSYSYNLPDGSYIINYNMAAPNSSNRSFSITSDGGSGQRVDNITLDILGGSLSKYTLSVNVVVKGGLLTSTFKGIVGNALVNSISISRVPPHYVTETHPIAGAAGQTLVHTLNHKPIQDTLLFVFELNDGNPPYIYDNYLIRVDEVKPYQADGYTVLVVLGDYTIKEGTLIRYFYMTEE